MTEPCICGHKKHFDQCCGRFLTAGEIAKTPEQLMRSRYSAYALGKHGDYLLATWWPANARDLTAAALSEKSLDWIGLEVLARTQSGDRATVEFKARYRGAVRSEPRTLHEVSNFLREDGRWFYVDGEILS